MTSRGKFGAELRYVVDRRAHRAPEEDVAGWRDRQPDRRRARRGQPQRGHRQGAPPRPRAAPVAGQAGRGKGQEGRARAGRCEAGASARTARGLRTATPSAPSRSQPPASDGTPLVARSMQYRSIGPGGFIRQGPGDQQAPIPPAPPRRLVPAKPSPEVADKTSLLELNDRICKWPIGHPGEPDFHFCGARGQPRLSLLRPALRSRLPGAAAAPRPPPAAAAAVRRDRGSARAAKSTGFTARARLRPSLARRRTPASRLVMTCHAGSSPRRNMVGAVELDEAALRRLPSAACRPAASGTLPSRRQWQHQASARGSSAARRGCRCATPARSPAPCSWPARASGNSHCASRSSAGSADGIIKRDEHLAEQAAAEAPAGGGSSRAAIRASAISSGSARTRQPAAKPLTSTSLRTRSGCRAA